MNSFVADLCCQHPVAHPHPGVPVGPCCATVATRSAAGGDAWTPAGRRCWCLPIAVTATVTPAWRPGRHRRWRPSTATVREALDLLAAQAPTMGQVLAGSTRLWYVILDGTRIRIDRVAEDRPYYSGKHQRHGVNVQIPADARGRHAGPRRSGLPGTPGRTSSCHSAADPAGYRVTGGRSSATGPVTGQPANAPSRL